MAKDDKAYRDTLDAESLRLFPGTSRAAKQQRKAWRNEQRQAAGFRAESALPRGGAAGFWDRNKQVVAPVAAGALGLLTGGLAAPIAAGALMRGLDREGQGGIGFDAGQGLRGAAEGALAGGIGKLTGGVLQPTPAQFAASIPGAPAVAAPSIGATPGIAAPAAGGIRGMLGKAKDWALADGGQNLLNTAAGAYGVYQQAQGNRMMQSAADRDAARWAQGAPLRDAGLAGLLNPVPADTSSLEALAGQGNPFARRRNPAPNAGTLAGNPEAENPNSQTRPMPATAMRRGVR